ncbi:hypothetical protein [Streptomyces finlayi]|uniref:hypothetical protein n=1 Tax=Streptomyces finlayi TaxID=67296 RepID=UPI00162AD4F4|nr:hypothetical protein [Streptomyces finlayi]
MLIAFLLPFIDLGIEQSPMLQPDPPTWAHALPGYGSTRVLVDAAVTPGFDETGPCSSPWPAGLTLAATALLRHVIAPARTGRTS